MIKEFLFLKKSFQFFLTWFNLEEKWRTFFANSLHRLYIFQANESSSWLKNDEAVDKKLTREVRLRSFFQVYWLVMVGCRAPEKHGKLPFTSIREKIKKKKLEIPFILIRKKSKRKNLKKSKGRMKKTHIQMITKPEPSRPPTEFRGNWCCFIKGSLEHSRTSMPSQHTTLSNSLAARLAFGGYYFDHFPMLFSWMEFVDDLKFVKKWCQMETDEWNSWMTWNLWKKWCQISVFFLSMVLRICFLSSVSIWIWLSPKASGKTTWSWHISERKQSLGFLPPQNSEPDPHESLHDLLSPPRKHKFRQDKPHDIRHVPFFLNLLRRKNEIIMRLFFNRSSIFFAKNIKNLLTTDYFGIFFYQAFFSKQKILKARRDALTENKAAVNKKQFIQNHSTNR